MKRFLPFFLIVCALPSMALAAYDEPYIGDMESYSAKYEDTFVHLARDYNLGFVEMRAANPGVDPWIPGAGTNIVLPTRHLLPDAKHEGVVINISEMRLYVFEKDSDEPPVSFPLGIGRDGLETPMGETKVVRKVDGPTWYPTERMRKEDPELPAVVPPGYDNPMGSHSLYLGWPQYAIHGTNRPFGIGRRVSSGCIRMYPEDIAKFYDMIPVNTKVTVVDQPVKAAWIDGRLYVEAHPTQQQAESVEEKGYIPRERPSDKEIERIVDAAGQNYKAVDWDEVAEVLAERRGYPIAVTGTVRRNRDSEDALGPFDMDSARKEAIALIEGIFDANKDVPAKSANAAPQRTRALNP